MRTAAGFRKGECCVTFWSGPRDLQGEDRVGTTVPSDADSSRWYYMTVRSLSSEKDALHVSRRPRSVSWSTPILTLFTTRSHYVTSLSSSRRKTVGGNGAGINGNGGGGSGTASSDDLPVASGSGSGSAPGLNAGSGLGESSRSKIDDDVDGGDKKRIKRRKPRRVGRAVEASQ